MSRHQLDNAFKAAADKRRNPSGSFTFVAAGDIRLTSLAESNGHAMMNPSRIIPAGATVTVRHSTNCGLVRWTAPDGATGFGTDA